MGCYCAPHRRVCHPDHGSLQYDIQCAHAFTIVYRTLPQIFLFLTKISRSSVIGFDLAAKITQITASTGSLSALSYTLNPVKRSDISLIVKQDERKLTPILIQRCVHAGRLSCLHSCSVLAA